MILAFGKYKGWEIEDVPDDYLEWLDEQEWVKPSLRLHLDNQLIIRGLKSADIYTVPSPENSQISTIYKSLAKKYHPDRGGNEEAMKAINEFYSELKRLSA